MGINWAAMRKLHMMGPDQFPIIEKYATLNAALSAVTVG